MVPVTKVVAVLRRGRDRDHCNVFRVDSGYEVEDTGTRTEVFLAVTIFNLFPSFWSKETTKKISRNKRVRINKKDK